MKKNIKLNFLGVFQWFWYTNAKNKKKSIINYSYVFLIENYFWKTLYTKLLNTNTLIKQSKDKYMHYLFLYNFKSSNWKIKYQ